MENDPFPEIDNIQGIRLNENNKFSEEKLQNGAKEASYRKVSAYTKGVAQYKLERARRQQVRVLAEKGLTQKQIASQLGVSTRTVKRDWNKIKAYVKGQFRKEISKVGDERQQEFERRYEGLTVNEELKLLKQDLNQVSKKIHAFKGRNGRKGRNQKSIQQMDYTFDLDNLTIDGSPCLVAPPDGSTQLSGGQIQMKFYALKKGEKRELLNINVSINNTSPFH